MNIEKAIETAIEYEKRVHEVYLSAIEESDDQVALKVFNLMAKEEAGHISYLKEKLVEWREDGHLKGGDLKTALPSAKEMEAAVKKLVEKVGGETQGRKVKALEKAFEVEKETSAFYRDLVQTLPQEGRDFFERFLAIEEGHVALVQAEMDAVSQAGFWFDVTEFDLESA